MAGKLLLSNSYSQTSPNSTRRKNSVWYRRRKRACLLFLSWKDILFFLQLDLRVWRSLLTVFLAEGINVMKNYGGKMTCLLLGNRIFLYSIRKRSDRNSNYPFSKHGKFRHFLKLLLKDVKTNWRQKRRRSGWKHCCRPIKRRGSINRKWRWAWM